MSRANPQFKLRMPPGLRSQVEQSAKAAHRSLNAELIVRLEASFFQEQATNEKHGSVSSPAAPAELRLLCLLVQTRTGTTRALPIHTVHPLPPRISPQGRWSLEGDTGIIMRPAPTRRPTAEVVVRCARQRQANAFRAAPRAVQVGGLSHAMA